MHTILMVERYRQASELARQMLPQGFELVATSFGSDLFNEALPRASFLLTFPAPPLGDEFFRAAPNLRLIQLMSAGYDRCDIEAARRAGVAIATNGGANAGAVAEHTIMLMLGASRRVAWLHNRVVEGKWQADGGEPSYRQLSGATIGIVGLGAIGRKVGRLATAFGMSVLYYSRTPLSMEEEDATGFRFALLPELLREADFITLHVPLSPVTRGMIGAREIAMLKSDAVLVNMSRGEVVDEPALIEALRDKRILAAGLDTFAVEPLPVGHPLTTLDNVVLTPHRGGFSVDNLKVRMRNFFFNFQKVAGGDKAMWVVPELKELGQ